MASLRRGAKAVPGDWNASTTNLVAGAAVCTPSHVIARSIESSSLDPIPRNPATRYSTLSIYGIEVVAIVALPLLFLSCPELLL